MSGHKVSASWGLLRCYGAIYFKHALPWRKPWRLLPRSKWLQQSLGYYAAPRQATFYEVARLFVAARLASAQQQYAHAATLFGLAEQAHGQIHHAIGGPMRALADAALATVQATLEPAAFAEAFAAGQGMKLEEAFATRLSHDQGVG